MTLKTLRINCDCLGCGDIYQIGAYSKKQGQNKLYCGRCLIKLSKSYKLFESLPIEHHAAVFKWRLNFDVAVQYLKCVNSKIRVVYDCEMCNSNCSTEWSKILIRKHHVFDKLCYECIQRSINLDPIRLQENADRSRELWHSDVYRSKCTEGFKSHNTKLQQDPEYLAKHRRNNSRSITGSLNLENRSIHFDSGYELLFIDYALSNNYIIRRCEFAISYGSHYYHPDFFIIKPDGKRVIVEIKGYYNKNVEDKKCAAIEYINNTGIADEYHLCYTDELISLGILSGVGGFRLWKKIARVYNERSITFTEEKHTRIAEIGRSRYNQEIKNKKDL